MAATIAQIAELRRKVADKGPTPDYSDAELATYIEREAVTDVNGREPAHVDWVATYDLNATAAEVWMEKAAAAASRYDSTTDGATLARSQLQAHANKMAKRYSGRKRIGFAPIAVAPRPEYADEEA